MGISLITSIIAILLMFRVVIGYVPILYNNAPEWHKTVSLGVVVMMITILSRSFYWDILQALMGDGWPQFRDSLGGQEFSSVFNIGIVLACVILLNARKALTKRI